MDDDFVVGGDDAKTVGFQETRFFFACTCMDIMVGVQKGEEKREACSLVFIMMGWRELRFEDGVRVGRVAMLKMIRRWFVHTQLI